MNIAKMAEALGAVPIEVPDTTAEILGGYTSDMLSDVIAHAQAGSVLITLQGHINTVAVASLAGVRAILLVHGREAPENMRAAARRERVAILVSPEDQYTLSHRIHALLNPA